MRELIVESIVTDVSCLERLVSPDVMNSDKM